MIVIRLETKLVYLDYLDYSVGSANPSPLDVRERLRFDLLLFPEEILCLSVPACIKLQSTAQLLMELTLFWSDGRLRLILSDEHNGKPENYFEKRTHRLETSLREEVLVRHFEFVAYSSDWKSAFYDVYIPQIVMPVTSLYLPKISDTDREFRESSIDFASSIQETAMSILPLEEAIAFGKAASSLIDRAHDQDLLFQRAAILNDLSSDRGVDERALSAVAALLDRCFAYANAISAGAVPVSQVFNRFTSRTMIPFLNEVAPRVKQQVDALSWAGVYELSNSPIWLDFLDRLNYLLVARRFMKGQETINPGRLASHLTTERVINGLLDVAGESAKDELLLSGIPLVSLTEGEDYVASLSYTLPLGHLVTYERALKAVNESIPYVEHAISAMKRPYRLATERIGKEGYEVFLSPVR